MYVLRNEEEFYLRFSWDIYSKFLKCLHYEHFKFCETTLCVHLGIKKKKATQKV